MKRKEIDFKAAKDNIGNERIQLILIFTTQHKATQITISPKNEVDSGKK